jgi:hypothetical protein
MALRYFSESALFNGLPPIQLKKSGHVSRSVRPVSDVLLSFLLASGAIRGWSIHPADSQFVAQISVFNKIKIEIFLIRRRTLGRQGAVNCSSRAQWRGSGSSGVALGQSGGHAMPRRPIGGRRQGSLATAIAKLASEPSARSTV